MNGVKKTVPKWRNAYIARAHGDILNLNYAYVYCAQARQTTSKLITSFIHILYTFCMQVKNMLSHMNSVKWPCSP